MTTSGDRGTSVSEDVAREAAPAFRGRTRAELLFALISEPLSRAAYAGRTANVDGRPLDLRGGDVVALRAHILGIGGEGPITRIARVRLRALT